MNLYRLYDHRGRLLYVGITNNTAVRFKQHEESKSWWGEVKRYSVESFASRAEAERAETLAIQTESPAYNVAGRRGGDPALTARVVHRELISIPEAASLLGVNPKTIRRRIADGSLAAHRVGPRLIRINRADIEALLRPIPTS